MSSLIIFAAKYLFILSPLTAGAYFLNASREKKIKMLMLGGIALPFMYVTAKVLGHVYYDPRPFVQEHFTPLIPHDADNGFPSDHTLITAGVAAVIYFFNRPWGFALLGLALLVGAARVAAGVHHPVDIVGSIVIAVVVSFSTWFFMSRRMMR